MCWVGKSIEFSRRWYWRQNVHVRCIVKITVVGYIYLWLYVTSGYLNSSQLLTPTEKPNTPWCTKKGLREKRIRWKEFHFNVLCLWFVELKGGLWAKKALGERGTRHGMWNSHNSVWMASVKMCGRNQTRNFLGSGRTCYQYHVNLRYVFSLEKKEKNYGKSR